ncbi:MAG: PstS family phosphate ABC transporter substrate-binding protein [Odoribacter sp.]|nr:PstS family phosphate ABC transporter substrate-binding protein [Odoribacter sp.]
MAAKNIVCIVLLSVIAWINSSQLKAQESNLVYNKEAYGELSGQIQLSGAFALYPMAVKWAEEFGKIHPKVKIDISAGGAGKGITDALAKVVDLGMVSRDIYPQEIEKGAFHLAVVKDAVVPTVNAENPLIKEMLTRGLTREAAINLWVKTTAKTWGDVLGTESKVPVHVYTRSDACGAAETFAAWLGVKQEDLEGTAVFGDPGVTSVVQRDKVGIGFNNIAYAYDINTKKPYNHILVMPIDVNNNGKIDPEEDFYATSTELNAAIAAGKYPSPPARELYLVSNGKPEKKVVQAFLEFILTEGQQYVEEVAYIGLSEEMRQEELSKLKK